jgi:hypothetical protein
LSQWFNQTWKPSDTEPIKRCCAGKIGDDGRTVADARWLEMGWKEQSNETDHIRSAGAWFDGGSAG